tara:strand:+ start:9765 stop:10193 length:429 start_codon:yes stop_codon:yes gene_type:complete
MAADAWVLHDKAKQYMGDGTVDLDTNVLSIRLYSSTSNIATTSVELPTNELGTANGYTAGGKTLTGNDYVDASGTSTFDATNPTAWTATGAGITARFAGIFDNTANTLIAHSLLDNTPADVTATAGNTFAVEFNASGIFSGT